MALPAVDPAVRLTRLIDSAEPQLRRALLNAIIAIKGSTTLPELAALIQAGRLDEAVALASRVGAVRLAEEYAAVFTLAGRESAKFLTDVLDVVVDFDQVNVRAVRIMQSERLRLIREFIAEQRLATRAAMVDGIRRGLNPIEQARAFRQSIGLTSKQQLSVQRFRSLLESGSSEALTRRLRDKRFDPTIRRSIRNKEPLSSGQVDRMVDRYNQRFVRFRANTIARTEALRAVHAGNDEGYHQAIEQGAVNADQLQRQWNDSSDGRVRSSHVHLDGMLRGIDETFPGRDGALLFPGDANAPASETVQCRCVLSTRIDAPPEA